MKEEALTDALVREFLLGKVADDEQERIENLFLTDSHSRETVLAIEQELIDEYLDDSLSEEDKERFLLRYAQTEEQQRKLRITKSIKDWAAAESGAPPVVTPAVSMWSRLGTQLRLNPLLFVPIAVTVVIAIVLAIVWLNSERERRKHFAVEQELAQLNSPESLREAPHDMTSYELKPFTLRSVESQPELKLESHIRSVELHLPWVQKERYATYRAEVRRAGDDEVFTIPIAQAEAGGTQPIRVRLLASMLPPGRYQLLLIGIAADGSPGVTQEFNFVVSD